MPIRPKDGEWNVEIGDVIYDEIDKYGDNLFVHVLSSNDNNHNLSWLLDDLPSFDVILYTSKNGRALNLNNLVVELGLAEFEDGIDDTVKNWLPEQLEKIEEEEEEEDWDKLNKSVADQKKVSNKNGYDCDDESSKLDFIDNYSFGSEDLENFAKLLVSDMENDDNKYCASTKNSDEIAHDKSIVEKTADETKSDVFETLAETLKTPLIYKYQQPMTNWQQCTDTILLRIAADERSSYNLQITPQSLVYS